MLSLGVAAMDERSGSLSVAGMRMEAKHSAGEEAQLWGVLGRRSMPTCRSKGSSPRHHVRECQRQLGPPNVPSAPPISQTPLQLGWDHRTPSASGL